LHEFSGHVLMKALVQPWKSLRYDLH